MILRPASGGRHDRWEALRADRLFENNDDCGFFPEFGDPDVTGPIHTNVYCVILVN